MQSGANVCQNQRSEATQKLATQKLVICFKSNAETGPQVTQNAGPWPPIDAECRQWHQITPVEKGAKRRKVNDNAAPWPQIEGRA